MIEEKWYPTRINFLVSNFAFDGKEVLKKNLAYNIQYLQYLSKSIEEEFISYAIERMKIKNYVIIGMSVIEGVLIALLDERNLIPKNEWRENKHKHEMIDNDTMKVTYTKKRTTPKTKKITLDEAINIVEKNNVLSANSNHIHVIRLLKDFRNRIHLDKVNELYNSDYNSFDKAGYELIRIALFYVLNDDNVSKDKKYLEFLNIEPNSI